MRPISLILIIAVLISCRSGPAQQSYSPTDVLVTINEVPVSAGEFLYSFYKSHQNEDTVTANSVDEYLQLFINYKLKVAEARKAGYDTIPAYLDELSIYQEQLKSSYRTSEHMVDSLKKEAYERMKTEIHASHLLIRLPKNPTPSDTLTAYGKIQALKQRAENENFVTLAGQFSEDPSARSNKGDLGFFTAFQMIYPFENAAYNTPVGQVSEIVRTQYGYHILKVHDKRKATGNIKLNQLLLQEKDPEDSLGTANLIFELQEMLKSGLSPEQVMETVDGAKYQVNFGALPSMSLSQMPGDVRNVAIHLHEKGQISDPVKSSSAWHIFILEEKEPFPVYSAVENRLDRMVRRTDRLSIHQDQLMQQLYKKHDLEMLVEASSIQSITDTAGTVQKLFTIRDRDYTLGDFINYLSEKNVNIKSAPALSNSYSQFIDKIVLQYEDLELVQREPELKWLLKEYEEGMLLFNIMEDSIWNKASDDKEGLENFIRNRKDTIQNSEISFNESKSKSITEYQQYLENKWLNRLKKEYRVNIHQEVLENVYSTVRNRQDND